MNSGDLSEFNRLKRRLAIAVIALVVVTAVGVVGFALIGGAEHGLLDALYMTVITLTTVGFGEIIDMSNSPAGRVFTLLLLLVGFAIVLYAVPMMTAFVIEGQLLNIFARRRMEKSIRSISDHYVVTGGRPWRGTSSKSWSIREEVWCSLLLRVRQQENTTLGRCQLWSVIPQTTR